MESAERSARTVVDYDVPAALRAPVSWVDLVRILRYRQEKLQRSSRLIHDGVKVAILKKM
jgi:hypothetical protein